MIQNYNSLANEIHKFNDLLVKPAPVQKIFSTSRYIAIGLRIPGQSIWLYLGRGKGYEGIWNSDKQPESFLRKIDKLLQYLRKHLSGNIFLNISLDIKDRIVVFETIRASKASKFYFFYKGRDFYFLHSYFNEKSEPVLFSSWDGKLKERNVLDAFDKIGRQEIGKEGDFKKSTLNDLIELEKKSALKNKELLKSKKFIKRKSNFIKEDLERVRKWKELTSKVEKWTSEYIEFEKSLLLDLRGKVKISGIKFNFNKSQGFYQRTDMIYQKIKRLKKAEIFLEKRFFDTIKNVQEEQDFENKLPIIAPIWKSSNLNIIKKKKDDVGEYEVFIFNSFEFRIGRNAISNDQLRVNWCKKEDWWFHIEGVSSAHAYLKVKKSISLDFELISLIGSALKDLSRFQGQEVPLIYTQVKNLKGVKGKRGSVLFKKQKQIRINYITSWKEDLNKAFLD